jgi:hypothetical protein
MIMSVLAGAVAIAAAEGATAGLVHFLKKECPWLITPSDLFPKIDRHGLKKFIEHGWDPELGWVRKPNTAKDEIAPGRSRSRFHIGPDGSRVNPGFCAKPPNALLYGDSYAFARQVNDDETWAHQLSLLLGMNVANRGVGNYGLDQAVLRLEREFDQHPAPVVIMCVVPETISRVLSAWKHFSEYGNTLAFKPRFVLDEGRRLKLISNPMSVPGAFLEIQRVLPLLQESDVFFKRKFKPDMLRFPYLWHLWRSRKRNIPLVAAAIGDRIAGGGKRAFCQVMDRNINLAAELYGEAEPVELLVALTERFVAFVKSRNAQPILVILPQLFDLKRLRSGNHYYAPFVDQVKGMLQVFDFGPDFSASGNDAANYIDDQFGGHLSDVGNRMVAEKLASESQPFAGNRSVGDRHETARMEVPDA